MMKTMTPEQYLPIAERLSSGPRILPRLLEVLSDPASDVSQVIELISFDQGLTAKVLRASNSAFVGLPEPARDVGEAANLLGENFIYQLASTAFGTSTFQCQTYDSAAQLLRRSGMTAIPDPLLTDDLD